MEYQKEIGIHTLVSQAAGIVTADMDGEKAMLDIEKGKYYGINVIGSRIWELIDSPCTVQEIVAALKSEYDILETDCQQDVQKFIKSLYAKGLVHLA